MWTERLDLNLGYPVVAAGELAGLAGELDACALGRVVVVSNPTVWALHGERLHAALAGRVAEVLLVPDGEAHKDLDTWRWVVESAIAARADRGTAVVAFGGGVVGDVAGFAAATALRGLPLVQVPTTLLAAVDSSVGGKTGVNTGAGKNLVGAFHAPRLVWIVPALLGTLSPREWRCGRGEMLKHAVLAGEGALDALCAAPPGPHDVGAGLGSRILASVRVKAAVVQADPLERGVRALLNLGHTLGHAVERVAGYGAMSHGEAVGIGLVAAAELGERRGWSRPGLADHLRRSAERLDLAHTLPPGLAPAALVAAMGIDKKRDRGMVRLVIPVEVGDVRLFPVPEAELAQLIEAAGLSS